jgi:prolyl-tRNA synthetase
LRFTDLGIRTLREPQHPLLARAGYVDAKTKDLTPLGRLLIERLFPNGVEERAQERDRPRHGLLVGRRYLVAPDADVPPALPTVPDGDRLLAASPHGDEAFGRCPACGYEGFDVGWSSVTLHEELLVEHHTPDCPGIDAVVAHFPGLTAAGMLKCYAAGDTVILVPGDRKVRVPMANTDPPADLPVGYIGPMHLQARGIKVLADHAVKARPGPWVTGANQPDHHVTGATLGRDFTVDEWGSFATVAPGDPCPDCGGPLDTVAAFEVRSQTGTVGATRALQLLADLHHDVNGLVWPPEVAPFTYHLVILGGVDGAPYDGPDTLWDDRDTSPGVKFADADLLGLPTQVIVGPKALARGMFEYKDRRTGDRSGITPLR